MPPIRKPTTKPSEPEKPVDKPDARPKWEHFTKKFGETVRDAGVAVPTFLTF
jgi:hypothetical protein